MSKYEGGCYCKSVRYEYTVTDETKPLFNMFCHCYTCRKFSSTSMQHLLVIPKAGFTITKGEDILKEFTAPDNAIGMYRKFCTNCGTNVYQGPKDAPFIGTFPTNYDFIEKYPAGNKMPAEFGRPGCHINMENSAIGDCVCNDDLPKFKDFPPGTAFGGSGAAWP